MSKENASEPNESSPGGNKTFTSVEAILARYVAACRQGPPPDIDDFLPSEQPHRLVLLEKLIAADLAQRMRLGQTARLEDYLGRFPELATADDFSCELIVAEYDARRNHGESPGLEEYAQRFPGQISRLRSELSTHAYISGTEDESSVSLELDPGTVLDDFEIECLLGVGSYARVYLARQLSLDRWVVLKVSRASGEEGKTLAQLDHPHIASVFSEQTISGRRLLAMRYVPGKTMADWMVHRMEINIHAWRGKDLLDWLEEQIAGLPGGKDVGGREEFAELRFVPAMCRMVLGLARALQHSHEQGVMHRDIKPANILIDSTGRALLMDFNVAERRTNGSNSIETSVGGTLAYMAPEHLAALQPDVSGSVAEIDRRSDIYSLGVVFYELLAGRHPWPHDETIPSLSATIRQLTAMRLQGAPQLPRRLPGVSPGLRSIVEKCLAPLAEDRYQSAAQLVED
ncbi:MAG: serine/threonine protein kinase, partial [Pirellulales bacterium]|nr:serine/threonine protein kinase [Pirellulales bacterium]